MAGRPSKPSLRQEGARHFGPTRIEEYLLELPSHASLGMAAKRRIDRLPRTPLSDGYHVCVASSPPRYRVCLDQIKTNRGIYFLNEIAYIIQLRNESANHTNNLREIATEMLLTHVSIQNFRGIDDLSLPLDELCVLIGENNSGKTTILDAIRLCLTRSFSRKAVIFNEYDYHFENASAEPTTARPIMITLTFSEKRQDEWPDEISQLLADAEQVNEQDLRSVTLRVMSQFVSTTNSFVTDYDFLNLAGEPLSAAKSPRNIINLQQLIPTFYLASLRDAAQEFRARSAFWGPFVRSLEVDAEGRRQLEEALRELNKTVLENHTAFDEVKDRLKVTAQLMPLGEADPVTIEAVPTKVFDVLSRAQVNLESKTGAQIPIIRHGDGTQSLAVICLFDAFVKSQLEIGYGVAATPLLALEEPEAHLHPSAIKAVGKMLHQFSGQKLISTHSGDLLAGVPLQNIKRLRRESGKIAVYSLQAGVLSEDEIKKLDYQVRSFRGSLLFSRCWLLVEGETEAPLLYECARAMGYDLYADGVSCIEFSQVGVDKYIRLADQLGIEWFVLADNDTEGQTYVRSARGQLNGRPDKEHICLLEHGSLEVFLCMEGFGQIYVDNISDQKEENIVSPLNTLNYWKEVVQAQKKNSKTKNSLAVAEKMLEEGDDSVPGLLRGVIDQSRHLAESAG